MQGSENLIAQAALFIFIFLKENKLKREKLNCLVPRLYKTKIVQFDF